MLPDDAVARVSGPGAVSLGSPTLLHTRASLSDPDVYVGRHQIEATVLYTRVVPGVRSAE